MEGNIHLHRGGESSGDYITEVNHQKIEGKTVDGSGGTSGWREGPSDSQTKIRY